MTRSASAVELVVAAGQPPDWVQLFPAAPFTLIDGRGPFRVADPAAVVAATRAALLGGRMPIDYDHAIDYAAPEGRPAPAGGWIEALEARADGIWGRVAWTERGAAAVRDREYRFLSPVFNHSGDGTVMRLLRAALTNSPAMTQLTALASARPAPAASGKLDPIALAAAARAHQRERAKIGIEITAAQAVHELLERE